MDHNIYQGGIGGPQMHDEGAVYSGKGKYQLHFLGTAKPKELTRGVIIAAVAIVLAILAFTTLLAGKQPQDFPHEIELRNAIGETLETAALKVGIKLSDMAETEPGVFRTSYRIKLDGVEFDLYFYENDGKCSGFAYKADYQADVKKASKDIYNALVNMRIKTFNKYPYYQYREDNVTYDVTRKNLRNHLENETVLLVKHPDDLTPSDARDPIRVYMDSLEASEDWEGRVGDYITRKAVLYAEKGAAYDKETQRVQLLFSYRIEAERIVKYA